MTEVSLCSTLDTSLPIPSFRRHHFPFCSPQEALMKIMEEICDLLPKSYTEQCEDFVAKYGTAIVEFLLSSAAPHTICTLLHLCLVEQTLPGQSHLSPRHKYNLQETPYQFDLRSGYRSDSCRGLSRLGLRLVPYTGHAEPTPPGSQLHPT